MSDSSVLIQTITTNSSKLDLIWLHYHSKLKTSNDNAADRAAHVVQFTVIQC